MLAEETIRGLARKLQIADVNVKREYFQHLFLWRFYQQSKAETIYFKGGTALRIIYQSPRFSEDLDFNAGISDIKAIEEIILETLSQIQEENIKTDIQESKETDGGYFATLEFGGKITINLQVSFRERETKGEVATIPNDFIPAYTVIALSLDQLIGEKMRALLDRKKARDFYDLYFILRDSRLRPFLPKGRLKEALEILQNTRINFAFELKQFLPRSHWMVIKDFKRILGREIQGFL